jgi:thioesterase domain-containing protein/acyl carrier protein
MGRIDDQVKIRGFRIELGEIQNHLLKYTGVKEAVVIARKCRSDEREIVAYVVSDREYDTSEMRIHLRKMLPDFMIPSFFIKLEKIPLTFNGKLDYRALPTPKKVQLEAQKIFVAPRDPLELQLTQIWEEVLNIRPLGVKDNFFDLGGHSLLAVRLMAQIQKLVGHDIPLYTLFQGATVESLACIIRQQDDSKYRSPLITIQPNGYKRPFFCVHPSGGDVLCYVDLARHLGSEQPFYGLQDMSLYDDENSYARLEDMAAHYIEALRIIQPQPPYCLGGWSLGGIIAFEMAQQLQRQGHKVSLLALLDSSAPEQIEYVPPDNVGALISYIRTVENFYGRRLPISNDKLQLLEPDEQLSYILDLAKKDDLVPPDTGYLQIHRHLENYRNHHRLLHNYVPQVYSDCVTLFRARDLMPEESHQTTRLCSSERSLGWSKLSTELVEVYDIPGNHLTILAKPHVQVLAQQLKLCFDKLID